MELNEKSGFIVCDNKIFSKKEEFLFYFTKIKREHKLYSKMMEFVPWENRGFYLFSPPFCKKMSEKKCNYLAQVIDDYRLKTNACETYFRFYSDTVKTRINQGFVKKQNESCVSYFPVCEILNKMAKMKHQSLIDMTIVLLCEPDSKTEKFIKEIIPFVKKIHIYSDEKEIFTPLIDYFFENYGILLTLGDTIGSDTKEKGIFISLTEDQNKQEIFIKAAEQAVQISPFLCKTPQYFERFYFDCNRSLERIIKKLGLIFDSESLIFLYSVWANEKNKKTFSEFTKKFDIKILKFVKND